LKFIPIFHRKGFQFVAFSILFHMCFALAPFWATGEKAGPNEVAQKWLKSYPQDLPHVASLTTPNMREGLSEKDWVRKFQSVLSNLGFSFKDWEVLSEETSGNQATVILKVYASTVMGDQIQNERYVLRKIDGAWLIDDVTVVAEQFLGEVM